MKLLPIKQVASDLAVSAATVKRLCLAGDLEGFKIGGQWRISVQSIERYLSKVRVVQSSDPVPKREVAPKSKVTNHAQALVKKYGW